MSLPSEGAHQIRRRRQFSAIAGQLQQSVDR